MLQPEQPQRGEIEPGAGAAGVSIEELQLAARNHGFPLEVLRYPLTPVGLHYLLTHYDIPSIDAARWRLQVDGRVRHPLALSLEELRSMPSVSAAVTMECAGNGRALLEPRPAGQPWLFEAVGTGAWGGVPLRAVLEAAGLLEDAVEIVFDGADRGIEGGVEQSFQRSLPIADAISPEVMLAYELNGAALPPQHGYPLRLVVPGWYGMTNVKWLTHLTVTSAPFGGYQQAHSYRLRQAEGEEGEPLRRIAVRSLMVPPGIPDFLTRSRTLAPGSVTLDGRAWSGSGAIESVQVSADGGASWDRATLERAELGEWAWQGWHYRWSAQPGEHELCSRATDEAGNEQPLEAEWNLGGYANNAVQRLRVLVREQ